MNRPLTYYGKYSRRIEEQLNFIGKPLKYKSNLWICTYIANKHTFQILPEQRPLRCSNSKREYYNLEQFEQPDKILEEADKDGLITAAKQLQAEAGVPFVEFDDALARDLGKEAKRAKFCSPYWDTADGYLENFGVIIPRTAQHTAGYFNVDQCEHPGLTFDYLSQPFKPSFIGRREPNAPAAIRRYLFSLSTAERERRSNIWGSRSAFGQLRIQLQPHSVGVQCIDMNGSASHWYNLNDAMDLVAAKVAVKVVTQSQNNLIS